jgi:Uma2 family endonuclease
MPKRMTLQEFFKVDQDKPYPELIDGVVLRKPFGGTWAHSAVQTFLMFELGEYAKRTASGYSLPELHCVFGEPGREHVLCPDLSFISGKRLPPSPRRLHGYHGGAPDIAIEVMMREESASRIALKAQLFLAFGSRAVWIPDPDERAVVILRGGRDLLRLSPGDTLEDPDVLPGFSLSVEEIFTQIAH